MLAAARTWGLTNTEFDIVYTGLCVLYAIAALRRRRALKTGRPAASTDGELPAISAAMLTAGAYGAVLSAVAGLLSRGALIAGDDGKPMLSDDAATTDDVEHRAVELMRAAPGITIHAMYRRLRNDPATHRLGERLVTDGLLARPTDVARLRRLLPVGVGLAALGFARIVGVELQVDDTLAPVDNLGFVPFMLMFGVLIHAMSLVFEQPGATPRGMEALATLYERFPDPGGERVPETDLAYVAALHGPAAVAATHPELRRWVDDEISWLAQRR